MRKQVLIIIWTVFHFISDGNFEKLTTFENNERFEKCERKDLSRHYPKLPSTSDYPSGKDVSPPKNSSLVRVFSKDFAQVRNPSSPHKYHRTLGTFISKRHVLTSSQSLFEIIYSNNITTTKWLFDEEVTDLSCIPSKSYQEIPKRYTENLRVAFSGCDSEMKCEKEATPKKAYLLNLCPLSEMFPYEYTLLLLELDKEYDTYSCLSHEYTTIEVNDNVTMIGLIASDVANNNKLLLGRGAQIIEVSNNKVAVPYYYGNYDRGGPMFKIGSNNEWALIGVGATPADNHQVSKTEYFHLGVMGNSICELAGICNLTIATTTTSTPSPPTTTEGTEVNFIRIIPEIDEKLENEEEIQDELSIHRNLWNQEENDDFFISRYFFNSDFLNSAVSFDFMGVFIVFFIFFIQ